MVVAVGLLWSALTAAVDPWPQAGTITAVAGEPEITQSFTPASLFANLTEYREQTGWDPPEVTVTQWPDGLGAGASYGLVHVGPRRSTYVLTGPPHRLILDVNGDGNLANDQARPLQIERLGPYDALVVTIAGEEPGLPIKLAFPVMDGRPLGQAFEFPSTIRRGEVEVGGRTLAFAISGMGGFYDLPANAVFFDLDGDGKLAIEEVHSSERYRVDDAIVNIEGTSYDFRVDATGGTLTLVPRATWVPERHSLAAGTAAPPFRFVDLDQKPGGLEDYRGRVVLLYFWAAGCAPCHQLTPVLVELHQSFHARGLEVLAVNTLEGVEVAREYLASTKLPGRPIVQAQHGELATLYRVLGVPSWFLIDRDGRIAGSSGSSGGLASQLARLFETGAGAAAPPPTSP